MLPAHNCCAYDLHWAIGITPSTRPGPDRALVSVRLNPRGRRSVGAVGLIAPWTIDLAGLEPCQHSKARGKAAQTRVSTMGWVRLALRRFYP